MALVLQLALGALLSVTKNTQGGFTMGFWSYVWLMLWAFFFIAYLLVLFNVVADIFRDTSLSGWARAIWIVFLVFLPALTAIVYLIARGEGLSRRAQRAEESARQRTDAYIRQAAGTGPAQEIAAAKALLADGTLTQSEFDLIKARALS